MRLIILAVLLFLLYQLVKKYLTGPKQTRTPYGKDTRTDRTENEMIKDPQCNTYYPKKNMIPQKVNGETLYFCSEACKNAYLESHQKK